MIDIIALQMIPPCLKSLTTNIRQRSVSPGKLSLMHILKALSVQQKNCRVVRAAVAAASLITSVLDLLGFSFCMPEEATQTLQAKVYR